MSRQTESESARPSRLHLHCCQALGGTWSAPGEGSPQGVVYKWLTFTVLHRSSLELKFHCRKSAFLSTPPICSLLNVANLWQRRTNCDPPSEAPVFLAHASPEEPSLAVSLRNIYFGCKLIPVRCCPLEGLGWPRVAAGNASLCGQGLLFLCSLPGLLFHGMCMCWRPRQFVAWGCDGSGKPPRCH